MNVQSTLLDRLNLKKFKGQYFWIVRPHLNYYVGLFFQLKWDHDYYQ